MLRRISPGIAASVELTESLEAAWQVAVRDIAREHNLRADPVFVEQQLPASQRFTLSVL